jgi:UDP-glucose 4-epimerase
VTDAVRLLAVAAENASAEFRVVNGGTGIGTPIGEIARALCRAWGLAALPIHFSGVARAGDPLSLVADAGAAAALGWQPQVPWQQGVDEYVAWFKLRTNGPVS